MNIFVNYFMQCKHPFHCIIDSLMQILIINNWIETVEYNVG
jgi:hypothetical protein